MIAAIEEGAKVQFRNLVPAVIRAAERVIDDPKHKQHVPLIISLLGRLGYSEKAQVDLNVSGTVTVDHTAQALEDLRKAIELGFSEAQLESIFGHSGLGRYRKMLEGERKTIEHIPATGSVPEYRPPGRELPPDDSTA